MAESSLNSSVLEAVNTLCDALSAEYINLFQVDALQSRTVPPSSMRCILSTGTLAYGVLKPGDTVRLVCMTANSRRLFWSFVHESLQLSDTQNMKKERERGVMELSSPDLLRSAGERGQSLRRFLTLSRRDQMNGRFYLHYCRLPSAFPIQSLTSHSLPRYPAGSQAKETEHSLERVRGLQSFSSGAKLQGEPARKVFQSIYHICRQWAEIQGLIGARFDYLASIHLIYVAYDALPEDLPQILLQHEINPATFLRAYTSWDLEGPFKSIAEIASDEQEKDFDLQLQILGITSPNRRIHLSREARCAITRTLTLSTIKPFITDREPDPQSGYRNFLADYPNFLLIECEAWAPLLDRRQAFQRTEVPRNIAKLLHTLRQTELQSIHSVRMWPDPITHSADEKEQVFVLGVETAPPSREHPSPGRTELDACISQIAFDYDSVIGTMIFTPVARVHLQALLSASSAPQPLITPSSSHPDPSTSQPSDSQSGYFRPAGSVLARLTHDPAHASIEYEVGYVDRFTAELMWMPLARWVESRAVEELTFVPEHRVRRVRRVEDGGVVWDREERVDRS